MDETAAIREAARAIADEIISAARNSGPDPIAWVTGNAYVPPLRSFPAAERIWQESEPSDDGSSWEYLAEMIETYLSEADVSLECPDYDNALYAVDTRRFEFSESLEGDSLQDDWRMSEL